MSTEQTQGTLIAPDFSQTQDKVEPGIYKVRIIDAKLDKWTGKDGKPDTQYINWRMETFGEAEDKNNGRSIFHRTPTEGKGAFRLQDFYRAATGEALVGNFDYTMLYGREVEITIGQQKEKPEYTEVKAVHPIKH